MIFRDPVMIFQNVKFENLLSKKHYISIFYFQMNGPLIKYLIIFTNNFRCMNVKLPRTKL